MRSFIKWVGGKHQLIEQIVPTFPRQVGTYFEPFVGGGAIFFALASEDPRRFEKAVLCDVNRELINLYKAVRSFPQDLMKFLRELEDEYEKAPKETYLKWRGMSLSTLDSLQLAARFILLNKAGFNGLYRVNKKGGFNVPWGQKPTVSLFDEKNLLKCSHALEHFTSIHHRDFTFVLDQAKEGDLVYFDPPYVPVSTTSNFTAYSSDGFGPKDQQRLAETFRELHKKGVYVVLSNSDTSEIRSLYEGFDIQAISAKRAINSKGDKRGPVGEVLVYSRQVPLAQEKEIVPPVCPVCGKKPLTWRCPKKCIVEEDAVGV